VGSTELRFLVFIGRERRATGATYVTAFSLIVQSHGKCYPCRAFALHGSILAV
jgi:hypothetical protein